MISLDAMCGGRGSFEVPGTEGRCLKGGGGGGGAVSLEIEWIVS